MPIARPPQAQELITRWLSPLAPGDTVTVAAGDSCVSMQFGKVLGVFAPGTHALPAQIPDGVELWFCFTGPVVARRFGGNLPAGGSAFGEYTFQVTTGHLLVSQVAGSGDVEGMLKYLDGKVLNALGVAFGLRPPDAAGLEQAKPKAAAALNTEWTSVGVSFVSFDKLMMR